VSSPALTSSAPAIDPTFENVWDELVWRGLVHVSTDQDALRALLAGPPIVYYCGFDPTAPSLHPARGPPTSRSRRRIDRTRG
jgi:tyrosyl-tRNA synthetase